ncbi:hypothetical protein KSP40_PGU011824 [Platanthera guangdongensis]|uniref:Uncharacterized protein n=1 Tax=Platanthera guangdongensis TaxID=2320717 RepID=A0ABR2N453_9ASPA
MKLAYFLYSASQRYLRTYLFYILSFVAIIVISMHSNWANIMFLSAQMRLPLFWVYRIAV